MNVTSLSSFSCVYVFKWGPISILPFNVQVPTLGDGEIDRMPINGPTRQGVDRNEEEEYTSNHIFLVLSVLCQNSF